jgi:putative acetyltransferase
VSDSRETARLEAFSEVPVRVVDYSPKYRADFARLNIEWLERWFSVEPVDIEVLNDPETSIISGGGRVLFAVDDDDAAVGTVALRHEGEGRYELTKMAVDPAVRGTGIGRLLMNAALDAFRELDGCLLFLESARKLEAAIAMYASAGFVHRPRPGVPSKYTRTDVYMVWEPT